MNAATWDAETIGRLNSRQHSYKYHPFTCRNNSDHILKATPNGWACPVEGCGYTQNWAHPVPTSKFPSQCEALAPAGAVSPDGGGADSQTTGATT